MEVPELAELNLPFFERVTTIDFITEISNWQEMTIFAGAGVSIDRTGMLWSELVTEAAIQLKLYDKVAPTASQRLGPMQFASALVQLLGDGHEDPRDTLAEEVQSVLYRRGGRLKGQTMAAICDLAIEFYGDQRPFRVLTTNFDGYLEEEYGERIHYWTKAARAAGDIELLEQIQAAGEQGLAIQHIHGSLPRKNRDPDQPPVLSEFDYHESRAETAPILTEHFASHNVLMVGTSLTDPPLIDALISTRDAAEDQGLSRFALLPREDIEASQPTEADHGLLVAWQDRLSHLGVQGVFVDYKSQVGQFVREIQTAISTSDYASSDILHGRRLRRWWEAWSAGVRTADLERRRQEADHETLCEALTKLRKSIKANNEQLKIEVWLRWDPPQHRELRLWCSTYSLFTDYRLGRTASIPILADDRPQQAGEITAGEPKQSDEPMHVAAHAFREGRPVHIDTEKDKRFTRNRGRWKTFVAMPLRVDGTEVNLVVGSIVVASKRSSSESKLRDDLRQLQTRALNTSILSAASTIGGLRGSLLTEGSDSD